MSNYTKTRFIYLRSAFKHQPESRFSPRQYHPHTCVAVRIDRDSQEIEYALARRESPGNLIVLKRRMNRIKELGGVVPNEMYQRFSSLHKDYSKKRARMIACRRLDLFPKVIKNVKFEVLNGHQITRMIMEDILADVPEVTGKYDEDLSVELPSVDRGAPRSARESAFLWLRLHVEECATLRDLPVQSEMMVDEGSPVQQVG